ncbi:MAG: M48 family metalloprotease [Candidatus Eremiobacteraeota bacterium]|nr:M48 family metalloprotease [Candidatus Eremiobacteraeota bacterium]
MRRFLIGLAGGFASGYLGVRAAQMVGDAREPYAPLAQDPQRYGRLRRALALTGLARSIAELGFIAYGIAPVVSKGALPESRRRRVAWSVTGLLASALADTPIAYVEGHVFERRYALTKQDARAWLSDQGKGVAVSLALGVPLIELLASAIERYPKWWPALATVASFPLLVLANVLVPSVIAPLFNRFEPLEGPLAERLRALAARYGAGDAHILRVDMSRQTEKANAYVTGVFGSKRIVIGDTLLGPFEEREVEFVVAHELGHYLHRDAWRAVGVGTAAAGALFFGARGLAGRTPGSLASTNGLARLAFAATALGIALGPLLAAYSRTRERAADAFAIEATRDPQAGADAFRRLRDRNLAEDEQPKWAEVLFATHPSLGSRIRSLEERAARS